MDDEDIIEQVLLWLPNWSTNDTGSVDNPYLTEDELEYSNKYISEDEILLTYNTLLNNWNLDDFGDDYEYGFCKLAAGVLFRKYNLTDSTGYANELIDDAHKEIQKHLNLWLIGANEIE